MVNFNSNKDNGKGKGAKKSQFKNKQNKYLKQDHPCSLNDCANDIDESKSEKNNTERFQMLQMDHDQEMQYEYNQVLLSRRDNNESEMQFKLNQASSSRRSNIIQQVPQTKAITKTKFTIPTRVSSKHMNTFLPRKNIYDGIPENVDDCVTRRKREVCRMTYLREDKISRNVVNKFKKPYYLKHKSTNAEKRRLLQNTTVSSVQKQRRKKNKAHSSYSLKTKYSKCKLNKSSIKSSHASPTKLNNSISVENKSQRVLPSAETPQVINYSKKNISLSEQPIFEKNTITSSLIETEKEPQIEALDMSMQSANIPAICEEIIDIPPSEPLLPQTEVLDLSVTQYDLQSDEDNTAMRMPSAPIPLVNVLPSETSLRRMLADALSTMTIQERKNHLSKVTEIDAPQNILMASNSDHESLRSVVLDMRTCQSSQEFNIQTNSVDMPTYHQLLTDHSHMADGCEIVKEKNNKSNQDEDNNVENQSNSESI